MKTKYIIAFGIIFTLATILIILWFVRKNNSKKVEETAMREFKHKAKQFTGYYQALYDSVKNIKEFPKDKLLEIWEQRMEDETAIIKYYNILRKKNTNAAEICSALLTFIEASGIIHDRRENIIISEKHRWLYLFDDVYELGDAAEIITPAWYFLDGKNVMCVEQGIAKIKE